MPKWGVPTPPLSERGPNGEDDSTALPTRGVGTPRSDEDDFEADKLTLTVERADEGKLRCTCATWSDAAPDPGEDDFEGGRMSRRCRAHRRGQARMHGRDVVGRGSDLTQGRRRPL
jgi:hypothetical protein